MTSMPAVVVSVHPPPSQVATGPSAASILMTPRDLRYLDYVLDGRLSPDEPPAWVISTTSDLERRPLTRHFKYIVYPYCPSQCHRQPLLDNGNTSSGRIEGSTRGEGPETGAGPTAGEAGGWVTASAGSLSPPESPALSGDLISGKGEQDMAPPGRAEPAVRGTAGPDPSVTQHRRTRRGGRRQRTSSALTPAVVTGGGVS